MIDKRVKARERRLLLIYGLTTEQFDAMLRHQENRCAVCRREFTETPIVDHDHSTKQVRGLLCRYCNHHVVGRHRVGLNGIYLLTQAARYLEMPPAQQIGIGCIPVRKKKRRPAKVRRAA